MSDCCNESESSLPIWPEPYLPSSPPTVKRIAASYDRLQEMDDAPHPKSEPATQVEKESKPPTTLRHVHSDDTERPPSAQQVHIDEEKNVDEKDEDYDENEDDDDEELDSDPAEPVVDFDWENLHQRYHEAMQGCHDHEAELTQEWEQLMNVQSYCPVYE